MFDDSTSVTGELFKKCSLCPNDKYRDAANRCVGAQISPGDKTLKYILDSSKSCRGSELEAYVEDLPFLPILPLPLPWSNDNVSGGDTEQVTTADNVSRVDTEQMMTIRSAIRPIAICLSYLILGRLTELPSQGVCRLDNESELSVNDMKHQCGLSGLGNKLRVQVSTSSMSPCAVSPALWTHVNVTWIYAKINYGLLGISMIISVCVWFILNFFLKASLNRCTVFFVSNLLWITWRCQETAHVDARWRGDQPYVCMFTGSLGYISESVLLYLMAGASVKRMHALVTPFQHPSNVKSDRSKVLIISLVCGFLAGLACSLLNIVAVLVMDNPAVAQTCQLVGGSESLVFLLTVKICSVLFIYVVPCCALVYCNVIVLIAMKKKQTSLGMRATQHRDRQIKKATHKLTFILIISLLITFCLPKAIFDLKRAFELYLGTGVEKTASEILVEGMLTNLTACALLLNAVIGMMFST